MEHLFKEFFEQSVRLYIKDDNDVKMLSSLVLAFVGDAVYHLFIRTYLVARYQEPVHALHNRATAYVKAAAQSDTVHSLYQTLSEEERGIFKRGRNAKTGTVPKHADVGEYKYATGFEALLGYLFLAKKHERLLEILKASIECQTDGHETDD